MAELLPMLPENWERCLVVAAHPDDIEYGTASATGEPIQRGIASLAEYIKALGAAAFEPGPFLTWATRTAGQALGVEAAVLFDVHVLAFEGPPPWL